MEHDILSDLKSLAKREFCTRRVTKDDLFGTFHSLNVFCCSETCEKIFLRSKKPLTVLDKMADFLDLEQKLDPGFKVSMFNSNFTLSDPKIATDSSETQKGKIKDNSGK